MRISVFVSMIALPVVLFGCSQLTPKDKILIAEDSVRIDMCVAKTHECKLASGDAAARLCWPVYDECMVGAGVKDGGSHE